MQRQPPFIPANFNPVLIMAPDGAGKSSLLAAACDAAASAAPAALVRIRHTPMTGCSTRGASNAILDKVAHAMLADTAARVYAQTGFPRRRAVLQWLHYRASSHQLPRAEHEIQKAKRTTSRLVQALRLLFEAAAAVGRERFASGLSRWDAAPVLLFDGMHDLICDECTARAGGSAVFEALARLLEQYCSEAHAVRAAVAGSSAALRMALDRISDSGFRNIIYNVPDPEEDVVEAALRARGYTPREAAHMVAMCGTRLQLLEEPLVHGAAAVGARDFIQAAHVTAGVQFADLFRAAAGDADARALVEVLDDAMHCEMGMGNAPPKLSRAFTPRQAEAARSVLYLRPDRTLCFQSRLHAVVWSNERSRFLRAARLQ